MSANAGRRVASVSRAPTLPTRTTSPGAEAAHFSHIENPGISRFFCSTANPGCAPLWVVDYFKGLADDTGLPEPVEGPSLPEVERSLSSRLRREAQKTHHEVGGLGAARTNL